MGRRPGPAAALAGALMLAACAGQAPPVQTAPAPAGSPQVASLHTGLPKPAEKTPIKLSDADFNCLVEAIYFEAGAEDPIGRRAVAHVVLRRAASDRYPDSVCEVVHESNPRGCQFSYWCDGRSDAMSDPLRWHESKQAATDVLSGAYPDVTNGALFFHARFVRPYWSRKLQKTATIGGHIFYR